MNAIKSYWNTEKISILIVSFLLLFFASFFHVDKAEASNWIEIRTVQDLKNIGKNPNGNYKLMNNINLNGQSTHNRETFKGKFDGQGYTISNGSSSLFYRLDSAEVSNLKLNNFNLNATNTGLLAESALNSNIKRVHTSGSIIHLISGGLVGILGGNTTVEDVFTDVDVSGITAGGIAAVSDGQSNKIINSLAVGEVPWERNKDGDYTTGGIVGFMQGNHQVTNTFYNRSIVKDGVNVGIGKTTSELRRKSTYTGWDFNHTWSIRDGSAYPTLNALNGIAPYVSLSKNSASTYARSQSTTIRVNSTGLGIKTLQYRWTTSTSFPTSGWTTVNGAQDTKYISVPTSAPTSTGNKYLHVKVTDVKGNVRNYTSGVFRIDRTPPSVSLSKNGGGYVRSHSTKINVSDSHSGLSKVEYRWTTSSSFPSSGFTSTSNGATVSAPTSTGNHYLHIKATDKAGNVRNFTSSVFRIDRTAPSAPSISAASGWQRGNVSVTITGGSDSHSGVARTEYRLNGGTWTTYSSAITVSTNGSTKVEARTIDKAGNISGTVSKTVQVDKTAPSLSLSANTTSPTKNNVTITATGSDSHSGVKRIQKPNGTWVNGSSTTHVVSSNGTYTFVVEDNAGNQRTQSITVSNIDKTLPSVSLSQNGGGYAQSHSTKINASDSGSGLSKVEYRWTTSSSFPTSGFTSGSNGTTTSAPTSTGNHYLHVRATDKAGNVRQFTSSVFRVDRTAPGQPTISAKSGWQTANQSVTIAHGSDSHSGVARTEYRLNNGSWTTYSGAISITSNGTTTVQARTIDKAGNISSTRSATIQIDKVNPTLNLSASTTAPTKNNVTITATGSDSHSGVKRIQKPDGAWVNGSSATHVVSSNGTYQFVVEDNAGRTTTQSITVSNIDKTLPSVSLSKNGGGYAKSHSTTINASDSGSGLSKVEYRWTTSSTFPTSGFTSGSNGTTTSAPTSTGNHYLHVKATDKAGNVRQFTSSVFRIDRTAPTGSVSASTTAPTNKDVTLTASGTDSHSGVKRIQKPNGSWVTGSSTTHVVSSNGTYKFVIEDNAGNTRTVEHTVSNIDKTLPSISLSKNGGGYARSHSTTINVSDSGGSGLDKAEYRWTTNSSFPTSGFTATSNGATVNAPTSTGNHYLHVKAVDKAGNERQFTSNVFRIDRTAPSVNISASTTAPTNKDVTLSVTASDSHSGVKRIQKPNGTWINGSSATHVVSTNGTYSFVVEDNAGNTKTETITVSNIDKVAPTLSLKASTTAPTNQNVVVTVNRSDDASGISVVKWATGNRNADWFNSNGTTLSGSTFTVTDNGTYSAYVRDKAGNVTVHTITISNIDRIPPTPATFNVSDNKWTNKDVVVTPVYPSDAHIKEVRIDGGEWKKFESEITFTKNGKLEARSRDEAGNWSKVSSYEVNNIDKVNPTLNLSIVNPSPTNGNVTVSAISEDADSGIQATKWLAGEKSASDVLAHGEVVSDKHFIAKENGVYSVATIDVAGNAIVKTIEISNIDRIPPVDTTFTASITKWTNKAVKVDMVYPNDAYIKQVRVNGSSEWENYKGEITFEENGFVEARSRDKAGNWSNVTRYDVKNIDLVNPELSLKAKTTAPTNKDVVIDVTASDSDSGIDQLLWLAGDRQAAEILADGVPVKDNQVVATENGIYSVLALDEAGNITVKKITVSNIDRIPPEKAVLSLDEDYWTNGNVTVLIEFPHDAHVKEVKVGNGEWKAYEGSIVLESNNSVSARSYDEATNVSEVATVYVTNIDKVDPMLNLTPETTQPINKDIRITVNAKDDSSGVESIKWLAGSHDADDVLEKGASIKSNFFTVSTNGVYSVVVQDRAKNTIVKEIEVKNIDKIAPESPALSVVENKNLFSLTHGEDEGLGTSHSEYRVNGGEWKVYEGQVYLSDGEYVFEAKTVDVSGNESKVVSIEAIFYYEYLTDLEDSFDEWEEFYPEDELEDIRDIIDNLPPNAEEREELEERYDRGEQVAKGYCEEIMSPEACTTWKLIKLIDGYDRFYTGLSAVEKRFEKVSKDDEFYPMLSKHMERLRSNVSNYYEQLREDKDINDAFSRVEDVEERYSPTREQAARNAIAKLIDEELQNHLLERLETAIEAHKEAGLEEAIQKAIEQVEIAENNPSTVNIKLAQNAVDNLPEGETKESLLERINALLPEKEEGPTEEELLQQQIDEAIALVEKAEKNYTTVNRIMATNAVNALPDSDIKTELLERLYLLENPVVEVDEEAEAIQQATEATENAEKYRTKYYVKLAHEAIYDLSDSEEKELLLERLDELKSELGLDDKGLFDKAVQEIDRHLRSPNITIYKNRALNAIEDVINEDHRAILEAYMAGDITKEELWASFEQKNEPEEKAGVSEED